MPQDVAEENPVQVLWTGGWDSSFRIMHLLLVQQRPVQPIYVLNVNRRGTMLELRTMERMRDGLLARLDDPSRLKSTTVVVGRQFPPRRELSQLRESILKKARIGSQYVMLAGVAEALGWHRSRDLHGGSGRRPDGHEQGGLHR
jgi:7-cyano-7-deazaguanine synthase